MNARPRLRDGSIPAGRTRGHPVREPLPANPGDVGERLPILR